eukprot:4591724-Prymnesium_polylepis.1
MGATSVVFYDFHAYRVGNTLSDSTKNSRVGTPKAVLGEAPAVNETEDKKTGTSFLGRVHLDGQRDVRKSRTSLSCNPLSGAAHARLHAATHCGHQEQRPPPHMRPTCAVKGNVLIKLTDTRKGNKQRPCNYPQTGEEAEAFRPPVIHDSGDASRTIDGNDSIFQLQLVIQAQIAARLVPFSRFNLQCLACALPGRIQQPLLPGVVEAL